MIKFRTLRYKNFLSTGNDYTELDFLASKTTLVVGQNGAGKSSFLDALTFALFNKPFRKINKPQLLNSITQRELRVEVEFDISQNKYKVVRGIKPGVFEVYKDGILLNQSADSKDYQSILENQILKVNYKAFCQVVVLGSASFVPFMELPLGARREIIEDLLDLQIFTTMNVLLRDRVSQNTQLLNGIENEKKLVEQKIQLTKQHLRELQQVSDKLISEKKERIKETENQVTKLTENGFVIEESIKEYADKITCETKLKSKLKKMDQLRHQLEIKIRNSRDEINFFDKHENCPTCKQSIDETFKCEVVTQKQKSIDETEDGLTLLMAEYEQLEKQITEIFEINKKITEYKLQLHSLKTKITSLLDYKVQLEKELNSLKNEDKKNDANKIKNLELEHKELESKYKELLIEKQTLSLTSSLLKDGGIKAKIIKQYVPIMNKLINKYLSTLEFMVQFELDESFEETIKSRFRDEFSYGSFSEGEKQKINIALLFAWRTIAKMRNSIDTNLLIMDEVLDSSLDSFGIEHFMSIIENANQESNIFIISHRENFTEKFGRIIKFEKHKNFSKATNSIP